MFDGMLNQKYVDEIPGTSVREYLATIRSNWLE